MSEDEKMASAVELCRAGAASPEARARSCWTAREDGTNIFRSIAEADETVCAS